MNQDPNNAHAHTHIHSHTQTHSLTHTHSLTDTHTLTYTHILLGQVKISLISQLPASAFSCLRAFPAAGATFVAPVKGQMGQGMNVAQE